MLSKQLLAGILLLVISNPVDAERFQRPTQITLDRDGKKWAQNTLKRLSLEEKIGQMFMIRILGEFVNSESPEYLSWRDQMARYHVGSILLTVPSDGSFLSKTEPYEAAMLLNQLQRDSRLPLIVAADFEQGLSTRLSGVTIFPHAMAFAAAEDPEFARRFGEITAEESRAVGVEWDFFPDADVNSNAANPIINTRAFGEDAEQVSVLVDAYIRGARHEGMLTTVKHFPGHGDTATDSHLGVATVSHSVQEIKGVDLVPFQSAIAAGVDAVMVGHVTVPALESDPGKVATTSRAIVSTLLKHELGFKGLVVTDALEMGGLMHFYPQSGPEAAGRAAIDAVKAGNDILVLPSDLDGAYTGLIRAVRSGEISEARIDESVLKILQAKASVGLNRARFVDVNAMSSVIMKPESLALAQEVADRSITLVREGTPLLPFQNQMITSAAHHLATSKPHSLECLVFLDDARAQSGRQLERELRSRVPDVQMVYVDPMTARALTPEIQKLIGSADRVIVAIYMVPASGRATTQDGVVSNSISLAEAPAALLTSILGSASGKTLVISFGSPYIAADFPEIENYMCAYSDAPVSEVAAAKALFGEISIRGHLPVSIPGFGLRGSGIQRSVVTH